MVECQKCHQMVERLVATICPACWSERMVQSMIRQGKWAVYLRPNPTCEELFAQVETVSMSHEIRAMTVQLRVAYGKLKGAVLSYPLEDFSKFWKLCDPPPDGPSVWERLMGEDVV